MILSPVVMYSQTDRCDLLKSGVQFHLGLFREVGRLSRSPLQATEHFHWPPNGLVLVVLVVIVVGVLVVDNRR